MTRLPYILLYIFSNSSHFMLRCSGNLLCFYAIQQNSHQFSEDPHYTQAPVVCVSLYSLPPLHCLSSKESAPSSQFTRSRWPQHILRPGKFFQQILRKPAHLAKKKKKSPMSVMRIYNFGYLQLLYLSVACINLGALVGVPRHSLNLYIDVGIHPIRKAVLLWHLFVGLWGYPIKEFDRIWIRTSTSRCRPLVHTNKTVC